MYCWITYEECGFWTGSCECLEWGCDADTDTDPDAPEDMIEDPDASDVPDLDMTDATDLDDLDGNGGEG
jgi:hypothetical protein